MRLIQLLPFLGLAFAAPSQGPFDRKTFTVAGGHVYSYHFNPPQGDKPTILLLHGFPSSLYDWRKTVPDLRAAGYGVIAPDLLGYGETSKPTAVEEYAFSKVSGHVAEILAHENVKSVIGVGHDIGAVLLSRFWNYYPESLTKLAFLAATYRPPIPWDVDAMNNSTEQAFGYPIFGYWRFVNETNAPETILSHHDSFTSLLYTNIPGMWKTHVGPIGALKKWLGENQIAPKADYLTDKEYQAHQAIFAKGGYTGPTNWYKAAMANIDSPNDAKIPDENIVIHKPVLFVAGRNDEVGRPELAQAGAADGQKSGMLPNVQVKIIEDSVHWMQVQKPKETFELLDSFIKGP
ncbi:alpha/beta-hydrolase [Periconia macrospinosa]|uniref:Alpha/beta-hydrolase n=1 Tax=Periconia macrospinosa TaxID=97972 RepID=A0A2V1E6C4_9PLEO|nr:alpha/beta-hydrolase [Periconia macrospinosa]